jgi:DNA-binding response OmpR family regulator
VVGVILVTAKAKMDSRPMSTIGPRILCIEKDLALLETRCTVLNRAGYKVRPADLEEAEILLHSQAFDLLILSATLNDEEKQRIIAAAGSKTQILALSELTMPLELLSEVAKQLRV